MAELEDLAAFGEVLVEGRALPAAQRRHLLEYVETRTAESPRYLALYRTAVSTLDRLAVRPLAHLTIDERSALVARHGLAAWHLRAGEEPAAVPDDVYALRTRVVPDLIRGYYASPAGWAVVGYEAFPGRCGELARYTRPEG